MSDWTLPAIVVSVWLAVLASHPAVRLPKWKSETKKRSSIADPTVAFAQTAAVTIRDYSHEIIAGGGRK
jgi:hypothetical protein